MRHDMFWSSAAKKKARKIQLLRRIQDAIGRGERATPISIGMTEKELQDMDDEGSFDLYRSSDDVSDLSIYSFGGISDEAKAMLSEASEVRPASRASKICRALGIGLWDLAKIALGGVIGWYLKKNFP